MTPDLYSRFHPDKFGLGEVITEKPLHDALKYMQYRLFEPMIKNCKYRQVTAKLPG